MKDSLMESSRNIESYWSDSIIFTETVGYITTTLELE